MASTARQHYSDNGYCVLRGVVDLSLVDQVVATYQDDVQHSARRFFRQDSGRFERNELTPAGYVRQPFLDPRRTQNLQRRASLTFEEIVEQ